MFLTKHKIVHIKFRILLDLYCEIGAVFGFIQGFAFSAFSIFFSSTGQRPASYCHGGVSVVCACVPKLFLQKTSPQKLLTGFLRNFTVMFLRWSSFKYLQIIVFYEEFWLPWRSKLKTFKNLLLPNH